MEHRPLNPQDVKSKARSLLQWGLLAGFIAIGTFVMVWADELRKPGLSPITGVNSLRIVDFHNRDPRSPSSSLEVSDGETLVVCQSMFVPRVNERLAITAPRQARYWISFLPPQVMSGHETAIQVWHHKGELVWSKGEGVYRVHGDLALLLPVLQAHRLAQLLLSKNEQEREAGRLLKRAEGDDLIEASLKLCLSENATLRSFALRIVSTLVCETFPFYEMPRWRVKPDPHRAVTINKAEDVRRVALEALKMALTDRQEDALSGRYSTIGYACECLLETGNQTTADELARLLADDANSPEWDVMMDCLEGIYGLPATYEKIAICGNCTPEEKSAFGKEQYRRRRDARDKLLKWHAAFGNKDRGTQLDAVLAEWHSKLLHLGEPRLPFDAYQPVPDKPFLPLLRIGRELVPTLKNKQQQSSDLVEQAVLEFIQACITGSCNDAIVIQLLAGDLRQQILACNIIGAARRTDWQMQLDRFQYLPLPSNSPVEFRDIQTLRSAASAALLMCEDPSSLSLVKSAHAAGFDNTQSHQYMKYYTMPMVLR